MLNHVLDDNCLSIAMICLGVYLWICIINLIVELASEARSHKSPGVTSEGECFAPSDFVKRLRVKQVPRNSSKGHRNKRAKYIDAKHLSWILDFGFWGSLGKFWVSERSQIFKEKL